MEFKSINPYNGETVGTYLSHTQSEVQTILKNAQTSFNLWRNVPLSERSKLMSKAGQVLREGEEELSLIHI